LPFSFFIQQQTVRQQYKADKFKNKHVLNYILIIN